MSDSVTKNPTREAVENPPERVVRKFRPRVDILETEAAYQLVADVPGASEDQVELSIEKSILTLSATIALPIFEGYEPACNDNVVRTWTRNVRLRDDIDRENIEATLRDGVLRVTLPKAKTSLRTTVPVKRAE